MILKHLKSVNFQSKGFHGAFSTQVKKTRTCKCITVKFKNSRDKEKVRRPSEIKDTSFIADSDSEWLWSSQQQH